MGGCHITLLGEKKSWCKWNFSPVFLVGKVPLVTINSLTGLRFRHVLSVAFFTSGEPSTALMLLLHFLSVLASEVSQFTALQREMHRMSSKAALFKNSKPTRQAAAGEIVPVVFLCYISAGCIVLARLALTGIKFFTQGTLICIFTLTKKCCLKKQRGCVFHNKFSKMMFSFYSLLNKDGLVFMFITTVVAINTSTEQSYSLKY